MRPTRLPLVGRHRQRALRALSGDPLDTFPAFVSRVRERLDAGQRAYGDASFSRPVTELIAEIEQELFDVAGWSFVLWIKLQRLQRAAKQIDTAQPFDGIRKTISSEEQGK